MPGPDGSGLAVRIYTPSGGSDALHPMLVFFHGGGWVMGGLDTHDMICRHIAHSSAALVVSVSYRLAPEWPYPAALDDALYATQWLLDNGETLGGDASRLAVGGDSAGGTLAAAVARRLRDAGEQAPIFQWLLYPVTDFQSQSVSRQENADGYLLTTRAIDYFQNLYCPDSRAWGDADVSPLRNKRFSGLPPALIQTAQYDPLRDEGRAYGDALTAAGIAADYRCYEGMVHGFARMGRLVDMAHIALEDAAAALRRAFDAVA